MTEERTFDDYINDEYLDEDSDLDLNFNYDYSKESSKIKRNLERQVDDIHQRVIEKIQKMLKVDEETAKIYKAYLYNKVKKEQPELTSYDRATEMEKMTTVENLKNVDVDKWRKIIADAKENKNKEVKKETKTKTKKTKEPKEKKNQRLKKQYEIYNDEYSLDTDEIDD